MSHSPAHRQLATKVGLLSLSFGMLAASSAWSAHQVYSQSAVPAVAVGEPTPTGDPGSAAAATDKISLTAIPPRLGEEGTLRVKPGEKIQATIKVRNSSSVPIRIESQALDFIIGEDGETPMPVTDAVSNRWSLASWVVLSPTSQVLQPNQLGQVNVLIEAPADALPGGHYAMVLHRPSAVNGGEDTDTSDTAPASAISQQVGSLLYVTVEGPTNLSAFLRGLHFPKLTEYGPVPFDVTVENNSDIHIRPQITVEVTNWFGQEVARIPLESKNVFPLLSRSFTGRWDRVWGIGQYQARAVMSYGDQGNITVTKTSFWLIPYRLLLAVTGGGLVALLLGTFVHRHWRKRQQMARKKLEMLEAKVAELETAAPKSEFAQPTKPSRHR